MDIKRVFANNMKKYRIKPYISQSIIATLPTVAYYIQERYLFVFWVNRTSIGNKELAVDYCNNLNEKL